MHKYNLFLNNVNWGYIEISDDGGLLRLVVIPKRTAKIRLIVRDLEQKIISLLKKEEFEVRKDFERKKRKV